jgi:hypothetical protein
MNYAKAALSSARLMATIFGGLSLLCLLAQPRPWVWLIGGALFGVVQGLLQSRVFHAHRPEIAKAQTKADYYAPMWKSKEARPLLIGGWVAMGLVAAGAYIARPSDFFLVLVGFFGAATSGQLVARTPIMTKIANEAES